MDTAKEDKNPVVDIDEQMRSAYLDYAMSTIVARALPDARDGLKPVHRRILYAMLDMGIRANSAYKKSARIVGEVLGKYHPHGDQAVYEAMARMAQNFSMRYMLVDGQGNFGSIDGDPPAAIRYTEARLDALAEELLEDIDKNTVDFVDNFDGSLQEPSILPGKFPNLLLNGSYGIAVGMATNIPPHNLKELTAAISYLIDHYEHMDDVNIDKLMEFIPGPDFPTGGIIIGSEGIKQAYSTGRGRLIVRGMTQIEETKNGRQRIVITEIPYQVNKTNLIERIADLVRDGKITDISDLRDESDRRGMGIIIELKRGAIALKVLNQLYKFTPLQSTYSIHLLALVEGEPRLLSLKRALQVFLDHRKQVITRRSQYDLEKARQRDHILQGYLIALANLDAVIRTIKESPDADTAKDRLVKQFKLTEVQAQAILDMQLRRLAALERQKIEEEHRELLKRIAYLEDLLAHPEKMLEVMRSDLNDMAEKYGDQRRTRIQGENAKSFNDEDLVTDEPVLITVTQKGYIKRVAAGLYRTQSKGARGVSGQAMREEDAVLILLPARTLQNILFFSDKGKVFSEKAYRIPDANRTDKGVPIINVIATSPGERITAAVAVPSFDKDLYCVMATLSGTVKRIALSEFNSVRPSGMAAMKLAGKDELGWVRLTNGNDELILVTAKGRALRIKETDIRPSGRQAGGVTGIKLQGDDLLASMDVVAAGGFLLVATLNGYGKRTSLDDYPAKNRATQGVTALDDKYFSKTGNICAARVVNSEDEITMVSANGIMLRVKVEVVPVSGRSTRGSIIMALGEGDALSSLACLSADFLQAESSEDEKTPSKGS